MTLSWMKTNTIEDDWILIKGHSKERELSWLVESLKETLESLHEGVEECLALLAPLASPAPAGSNSTLVVSTHLSEAVKGYITRSGTSIIKGQISLNLPTLPTPSSTHTISTPYPLPALTTIYSLLADCRLLLGTMLATTPLTAPFLSDQFLLLSGQLSSITATLTGAMPEYRHAPQSAAVHLAAIRFEQNQSLASTSTSTSASTSTSTPNQSSTTTTTTQTQSTTQTQPKLPQPPSTLPPLFIRGPETESNLSATVLPPLIFQPPLPPQVAMTLSLGDGAGGADGFVLTTRTLAAADAPAMSLRERLGLAQAPRHDEIGVEVLYGDRQVRVREKTRIHVADPGMTSLTAKIGAMARVVGGARAKIGAVVDARGMVK